MQQQDQQEQIGTLQAPRQPMASQMVSKKSTGGKKLIKKNEDMMRKVKGNTEDDMETETSEEMGTSEDRPTMKKKKQEKSLKRSKCETIQAEDRVVNHRREKGESDIHGGLKKN